MIINKYVRREQEQCQMRPLTTTSTPRWHCLQNQAQIDLLCSPLYIYLFIQSFSAGERANTALVAPGGNRKWHANSSREIALPCSLQHNSLDQLAFVAVCPVVKRKKFKQAIESKKLGRRQLPVEVAVQQLIMRRANLRFHQLFISTQNALSGKAEIKKDRRCFACRGSRCFCKHVLLKFSQNSWNRTNFVDCPQGLRV